MYICIVLICLFVYYSFITFCIVFYFVSLFYFFTVLSINLYIFGNKAIFNYYYFLISQHTCWLFQSGKDSLWYPHLFPDHLESHELLLLRNSVHGKGNCYCLKNSPSMFRLVVILY